MVSETEEVVCINLASSIILETACKVYIIFLTPRMMEHICHLFVLYFLALLPLLDIYIDIVMCVCVHINVCLCVHAEMTEVDVAHEERERV